MGRRKNRFKDIGCMLFGHTAKQKDIDNILNQKYFWKMDCKCDRCNNPILIWIEPQCRPNEYKLVEKEVIKT